jgi:hypothetical protein
MNAVMWRLHRNQAYTAGLALTTLTLLLLTSGISMTHPYLVITGLVVATITVPLVLGLFWGAPLLASEFEGGTHNLAWTQGISRRRWLARNISWALLAAGLWSAIMAALVSWWIVRETAPGWNAADRLENHIGLFDIQGIVPVAYSMFAVALGIATGAVFRRVVPAMATTLAGFVAVRAVIGLYLRPHYIPPVVKPGSLTATTSPPGAVNASTAIIGPDGHSYGNPPPYPAVCHSNPFTSCLASHGFHLVWIYQPESRFWAFQGIEAGIFIVLTAALVALTYRIVLTRDA